MDYHPALLAEEGDDDSDDEAEDLAAREAEEELDDFEEEDSMTASQAARLVVLMGHARTCPGLHKSPAHAEVCRNVKYLMLHIRDCDGKVCGGALAGGGALAEHWPGGTEPLTIPPPSPWPV